MSSTAVRILSPELAELARKNCNENPDAIPANVVALQEWIKKSPHLKARSNPQLLLAFLRRCQFRMEDAKKRIDNYYALKNAFPEVLCERKLSDSLLSLYRAGLHCIPSKAVSATGPVVVISQYSKVNPKKSNPREAFKLLFMLLEMLAIESDNASIAGLSIVVDMLDVTTEQMLQYDPFLLKKTWTLVDSCIPLRFDEIHLVNMRREGQAIFSFVSSVLPSKMPFKFIVHKKAEDLYDHMPREAITIEYGGHNGHQAEAVKIWENKLLEYKKYFEEDGNYGTDEKLRIGLSKDFALGDLGGVSGSFRKLEVD